MLGFFGESTAKARRPRYGVLSLIIHDYSRMHEAETRLGLGPRLRRQPRARMPVSRQSVGKLKP